MASFCSAGPTACASPAAAYPRRQARDGRGGCWPAAFHHVGLPASCRAAGRATGVTERLSGECAGWAPLPADGQDWKVVFPGGNVPSGCSSIVDKFRSLGLWDDQFHENHLKEVALKSRHVAGMLMVLVLVMGCAGTEGSVGPKGETGAQGPVGEQGPAGLQGAPGADCLASDVSASLSADESFRAQIAQRLIGLAPGIPVGTVVPFAGGSAPDGWLLCNGEPYGRSDYPELADVLGTTWGGNNAVFNVPDLRAATVRGVGTSVLFERNATISLAQTVNDQMQGHIHTDYGHNHFIGHGMQGQEGGRQFNYISGEKVTTMNQSGSASADIGGPVADGSNGEPRSGAETTPKAIGLNYIIKY